MDHRALIGAALVAALAACGCGRSAPGNGSGSSVISGTGSGDSGPVRVRDPAGADAALGARVRVEGTAQNDKLSAVIEAGAITVYCLDVPGWPADRVGKPAAIEGVLERTDEFAAADPGDGLARQGTSGSIYVIRTCSALP